MRKKTKLLLIISFLISFLGCEKKYDTIIDFQNIPPVISNLLAPDSLTVSDKDTLLIQFSVKVYDPDGLDNISAVWFNSYRPDGSPTAGNPYYMYDDGDFKYSGDQTKGDGIYSRRVILPPGTSPGKRKFEFMAIDKANELSNIIVHYILVKQ